MKYETAFLSNYELNELLPLLNKWKENLNEEKNSIDNMIDKNNNVISFQIQKMLNNLSEIINIHYNLIDEYIFCITEYEVDLSDNIQKAKISYLKDGKYEEETIVERVFSACFIFVIFSVYSKSFLFMFRNFNILSNASFIIFNSFLYRYN